MHAHTLGGENVAGRQGKKYKSAASRPPTGQARHGRPSLRCPISQHAGQPIDHPTHSPTTLTRLLGCCTCISSPSSCLCLLLVTSGLAQPCRVPTCNPMSAFYSSSTALSDAGSAPDPEAKKTTIHWYAVRRSVRDQAAAVACAAFVD